MYLHDAIETILKRTPSHSAHKDDIAVENRRLGFYFRKKDGLPPEGWQIKLRAIKRPKKFKVVGDIIYLV